MMTPAWEDIEFSATKVGTFYEISESMRGSCVYVRNVRGEGVRSEIAWKFEHLIRMLWPEAAGGGKWEQ